MATVEWRTRNTIEQEPPSPKESGSLVSEEYVVKAMPGILGKFDMLAIYLLIIFYITNTNTAVLGGAAAFTFLALGGLTFFIPSVIATAQLGVMFPHEGSLYNWTHRAFGGYWSFFVAFCAWFPGVLVMITAGSVIVAFIQGLHGGTWLTAAWQQGVVIIMIILASGVIAVQRFRTVQNTINMTAILIFVAVFLIGLASVVWLLKGNPSQTDFSLVNWRINWDFNTGNISLFGLVTLAYLGMEAPLNMGGEIASSGLGEGRKRKIITGHLLWGTILVFIGYFIATFTLLVVEGITNGSASPFALVTAVNTTLGNVPGFFVTVCLLSFFLMSAVTYNTAYARLLLVAGIDQRLPVRIARLNKNRVPAAAIIFQTTVACVITAIMYFGVPYITNLGKPESLSVQIYDIMLAAATLVWAFSTLFLFINLVKFYLRDPKTFKLQRIFPMPVLWISIVLGSASCITAFVGTLAFSWNSTLIPNANWWYIIGGLTVMCLIVAAIGSMVASSEAAWEGFNKGERT